MSSEYIAGLLLKCGDAKTDLIPVIMTLSDSTDDKV